MRRKAPPAYPQGLSPKPSIISRPAHYRSVTPAPSGKQNETTTQTKSISSQTPVNIEVVVNVHATQTTTSEQGELGVITKPTRKLITPETSNSPQTVCACVFRDSCSNQPAATTVEDELKHTAPSSFTQSSTVISSAVQHAQTSRLTTLMVPFNNIEHHAKTAKTEPEPPFRTANSTQNAD